MNSRLFLWPSELEKVLDLSGARLAVVRENLETALKERRATFEQYLIAEKKKMDSFRLRDVREVLSLDDLKEKVAMVDNLMDTLDVRVASYLNYFCSSFNLFLIDYRNVAKKQKRLMLMKIYCKLIYHSFPFLVRL